MVAYVLSSRVRVARNLRACRFPAMANDRERAAVSRAIYTAAATCPWFTRTACIDIDALTPLERRVLEEKRQISPGMAAHGTHRLALVHDTGHFSLLVNEEDHLRIQAMQPGFRLQKAWRIANALESSLTEMLAFAYSDREGYVTACASNRGTGIRASVMVFVPGLRRFKRLIPFLRRMADSGCTIRGVYGEGSETYGDILQISTQIARDDGELAGLRQFEDQCQALIREERRMRRRMLRLDADLFSVLRTAYQAGRSATSLEWRPALRMWAAMRCETALEMERDRRLQRSHVDRRYIRRLRRLDELFIRIQPAHVLQALHDGMSAHAGTQPGDEHRLRAQLLQAELRMTPLLKHGTPVQCEEGYV